MVFVLANVPENVRAQPAGPQMANRTTGLSFQTLWIYKDNNTTGINLVMDGSGVLHAGFTAYSPASGQWLAYYATYAANCGKAANWSTVIVGDVGPFGGAVRVAVNNAGQPFLIWYSQATVGGQGS